MIGKGQVSQKDENKLTELKPRINVRVKNFFIVRWSGSTDCTWLTGPILNGLKQNSAFFVHSQTSLSYYFCMPDPLKKLNFKNPPMTSACVTLRLHVSKWFKILSQLLLAQKSYYQKIITFTLPCDQHKLFFSSFFWKKRSKKAHALSCNIA